MQIKGRKIRLVNVPTSIAYLGTFRKIGTRYVKNRDKKTRYALIFRYDILYTLGVRFEDDSKHGT